jgi:hypothetical protein
LANALPPIRTVQEWAKSHLVSAGHIEKLPGAVSGFSSGHQVESGNTKIYSRKSDSRTYSTDHIEEIKEEKGWEEGRV